MSSNDKQAKTELNISTHQQKDKDKSGDYAMQNAGADKSQDKHEKTSITFERKKVCDDKSCQEKDHQHSWNKDKDLNKNLNKDKEFHYESKDLNKDNKDWNKDLNKDKDWNKDLNKDKDLHIHKDKEMHDKSEENKGGIINTIKEKVKDVLGSGDNDKSKDKEKNKDVHMSSADTHKDEKFGSSTVGVAGSSGQHKSSNVASTDYHSSNLSSDKQFGSAAVGTGYSSGAPYSGAGQSNTGYSGAAQSDTAYASAGQATVDHKNLGAEHREVGYDKQSNVIPLKEKDKDTVHKVDVHGSLYTSGAGTTFEAK